MDKKKWEKIKDKIWKKGSEFKKKNEEEEKRTKYREKIRWNIFEDKEAIWELEFSEKSKREEWERASNRHK